MSDSTSQATFSLVGLASVLKENALVVPPNQRNYAWEEPEPWFFPTDDRSVINLEHILPKKTENNWPQFSPEEASIFVNRLGNQVLLRASHNSVLKSSSFEDKTTLATCPYVLTSQVAECASWTPTTLGERQAKLAELALKAWPI